MLTCLDFCGSSSLAFLTPLLACWNGALGSVILYKILSQCPMVFRIQFRMLKSYKTPADLTLATSHSRPLPCPSSCLLCSGSVIFFLFPVCARTSHLCLLPSAISHLDILSLSSLLYTPSSGLRLNVTATQGLSLTPSSKLRIERILPLWNYSFLLSLHHNLKLYIYWVVIYWTSLTQ